MLGWCVWDGEEGEKGGERGGEGRGREGRGRKGRGEEIPVLVKEAG